LTVRFGIVVQNAARTTCLPQDIAVTGRECQHIFSKKVLRSRPFGEMARVDSSHQAEFAPPAEVQMLQKNGPARKPTLVMQSRHWRMRSQKIQETISL
jgi:hypothetical protein